MTAYTPVFRLAAMVTGDPAVRNQWGVIQDATMPLIEQGAVGMVSIPIGGLSTYTLTTANNAADQARFLRQSYTGALSGPCTITVPNVNKIGWVQNATTGNQNIILTPGGGPTITVGPSQFWYLYETDGVGGIGLIPIGVGADLSVAHDLTVANNAAVGGNLTVSGAANAATLGATTVAATTVNASVVNGSTINATNDIIGSATVKATDGVRGASLLSDGGVISSVTGLATTFIAFNVVGGAGIVGTITGNGVGGTSYNTTSDYRLKVTFGLADTGDIIDTVPIYDGAFRADPNERRPLLFAHELEVVAPWAVTGEKDATDITGDIIPQMVDHAALVPLLWAEIKALRRRMASLEAR